jgi:hypothetical protein
LVSVLENESLNIRGVYINYYLKIITTIYSIHQSANRTNYLNFLNNDLDWEIYIFGCGGDSTAKSTF